MGSDSFSANAFADNFIRGYSFVDSIRANKKAEARLETRLAEERNERAFQRRRTLERDTQVREDRGVKATERERLATDRKRAREGQKLLDEGVTDPEVLAQYSDVNANVAAELQRQRKTGRLEGALKTVRAAGGSQRQIDEVTEQQGDVVEPDVASPTLSDAVAGSPDEFQFARGRGSASMQAVSPSEARGFSPEFEEKGVVGKAGDVIAGFGARFQAGRDEARQAAIGLAEAPARAITGDQRVTPPAEVGSAFAGDIMVPADQWTDADEFAELQASGDNAAVRQATERNREIMSEYESGANHPAGFRIPEFSRQGVTQQSGDIAQERAALAEQNVVARTRDFMDVRNTDSHYDQMIDSNPRAAVVSYLQDRATLQSADPELAFQMDARMKPVFDEVEMELTADIAAATPGSAQARSDNAKLRNLQASRDAIARNQPSINKQSDIRGGLKVGDPQRANDVVDTIYDPDRLVATDHTPARIQSAATTASRISPSTRRINDNQIQALAVLAEAGYVDKATALSVVMTGVWPQGKDPKGIVKIQKAGGTVYAFHNDDSISILPNAREGMMGDRDIGDDQIEWMLGGVSENRHQQAIGLLSDNAGWVRQHYNVRSQESMLALGRALNQSVFLSTSARQKAADDWNIFTDPKDAPTAEDILLSPAMRNELAIEFDVRPVPMPAIGVIDPDGMDLEPFAASLREGAHGPELQAAAQKGLSREQLLYIFWAKNATAEDIAAANAQGE